MNHSYRIYNRLADHLGDQLANSDCTIETQVESTLWLHIFSAVQEPVWRAVGQVAGTSVAAAILREIGNRA